MKKLLFLVALMALTSCASKKQDRKDIESKAAANSVTSPTA